MYATWIASAIAVFLGIGAFVYLSRWLRVQHEPGQVPPVDQEGFVKWLQGYERWYHKASFNNHLIFNICRVVPITLGFGIAVISSLPNSVWDTEYVIKNVLVVVLTGISTVTGAVVSQLRIGDLAEAREVGRIHCASLVVRAQLLFATNHPEKTFYDEMVRMKDELFTIEHEQAAMFAAATASAEPKGDGPSQNALSAHKALRRPKGVKVARPKNPRKGRQGNG